LTKAVPEEQEPIEEFTILLVEDKPKAVEQELKTAEEHVVKNGLKLNLVVNEDGKRIADAIRKQRVDVVVTDMNLTETKNGLDVIKAVEKSGTYTDVLLYSAKGVDTNDIREKMTYGFVEIVDGKFFADELIGMIDKNLRRWQDVTHLRGVVISKIIDVELKINILFARYFKIPSASVPSFHDFILENRSNSLEGKIASVQHILKEAKLGNDKDFKNLCNDLHELQRNRNYLAHCKRDKGNPDCLVSMGEPKKFDKAKIVAMFEMARDVAEKVELLDQRLSGPPT